MAGLAGGTGVLVWGPQLLWRDRETGRERNTIQVYLFIYLFKRALDWLFLWYVMDYFVILFQSFIRLFPFGIHTLNPGSPIT